MLSPRSEARIARLLYFEIFWSSIMGGVTAFNAVYLLRLGGTNFDVSLNTALPSLGSVLISVPAGYFLQSRAHPGRWTLVCLATYWTGFLLLAVVPWVHISGLTASMLAVIILATASLPAQIFSVGIYQLLAEMVPDRRRVHVFAVRSIINACTMSVVSFVAGQLFSRTAFPGNYQLAYVIAWCSAMVSLTTLIIASRLLPPSTTPKPAALPGRWQLLPPDLARQTDFVHITINSLLHSLGLWLAGPLYVLFFVRVLGANDAWLGLYATVAGISTIAGLLFWRWVAEHLREARTLRFAILGVGFMPLLVGLVPNLGFILVLTAINGFFSGGTSVSHINVLLNTLPADRRPQFMGLYTAVLNTGAFAAPLLSVALADRWGLQPVLITCGALALLGSLSHWVWQVPRRLASPPLTTQPETEGAQG